MKKRFFNVLFMFLAIFLLFSQRVGALEHVKTKTFTITNLGKNASVRFHYVDDYLRKDIRSETFEVCSGESQTKVLSNGWGKVSISVFGSTATVSYYQVSCEHKTPYIRVDAGSNPGHHPLPGQSGWELGELGGNGMSDDWKPNPPVVDGWEAGVCDIYTGVSFAYNSLGVKWTPNNTTINLNYQGGMYANTIDKTIVNSNSCKYITTYGSDSFWAIGSPTRTGYIFKGWNTNADGKGVFVYDKAGECNNVSGWYENRIWKNTCADGSTINLYAVWEPITTTVMFHKNDGGTSTASQSFAYGVSNQQFGKKLNGSPYWDIEKEDGFGGWDRPGYHILGWNTDPTAAAKLYGVYSPVSNSFILESSPKIDLYGIWAPNKYRLTIDYNGATTIPSPKTVYDNYFVYNKRIANVYNSTQVQKTGHTFLGWYCGDVKLWNADGTPVKEALVGDSVWSDSDGKYKWLGNTTVKAKFTPDDFTLSFNGNGGSSPSSITQTYGLPWGELPESVLDGYTFKGWYTAEGVRVTSDTVCEGNLTVYAHWEGYEIEWISALSKLGGQTCFGIDITSYPEIEHVKTSIKSIFSLKRAVDPTEFAGGKPSPVVFKEYGDNRLFLYTKVSSGDFDAITYDFCDEMNNLGIADFTEGYTNASEKSNYKTIKLPLSQMEFGKTYSVKVTGTKGSVSSSQELYLKYEKLDLSKIKYVITRP